MMGATKGNEMADIEQYPKLSREAKRHLEKVRSRASVSSANKAEEFFREFGEFNASLEKDRQSFREVAASLSRPRMEVGRVEDRTVPGPNGEVPVRLYWPEGTAPVNGFAAIAYMHGGGYTVGDIDTHDNLTRELCVRCGMVICSVGYGLAPEHKFPAGVEDACAAVRWLAESARELGIDPNRIGVAGESAGGNIAAAVALAARKDKTIKVAGQFIYYAGLCHVPHFATPSRIELGSEGPFYPTRAMSHVVSRHYTSSPADRVNELCSPLLADDLTGSAPAVIVTAGFDGFRDEGYMYADRMAAFGVDVTYKCFESTIHGFLNFGKDLPEASEEAFEYFADTAKRILLR
jgi:acetyl esterase